MRHPAVPSNHNSSPPGRTPRFFVLLAGLAALPAFTPPTRAEEPPTPPALTALELPPTASMSVAYSSTWWLRFKACFYIIYHILGGPGGEELTPPELVARARALYQERGWSNLSPSDTLAAINALNGALAQLQSPPEDLDPSTAELWSAWTLEMRRGLPDVDPARP